MGNPPYYMSAYSLALKHGFQGTEEEWVRSLKGPRGEQGPQGEKGAPGTAGVGIASIAQVREGAEDGATNILSVALTDGRKAEFIVRNGHSGVYVGSEEPEDESVNVWINPDGETYDPPQGAASLQPLTFTGAGEIVYDGTQPVQVEIPTDDHINELINTALAGIPNASEVAY